jgi:hypothetical protein
MAQKVLPYEYEIEDGKSGLTSVGGLPTYLDLASASGLVRSIDKHLRIRIGEQGWTDRQIVLSLIALNLAGGDCVDDIEKLEADEGFCRILRKAETQGMTRKEKRDMKRRWRKERTRTMPSASVIFRYLSNFHDKEQERLRVKGKSFIPVANEHLRAFSRINSELIGFEAVGTKEEIATLDMDATLTETLKKNALYSFKAEQAYHPLNTYWYERGVMLYSEFRDGNVTAGHEQLRVLKEAISYLPPGIKKVRLRSDTAGYQHELLRYCDAEDNKRFGRIEFAIGCDVIKSFREAVAEVAEEDWRPFYREVNGKLGETGKQWAEVCFVPAAIGHSKNGPAYRYLATREELKQPELPHMEKRDEDFLFPVMRMKERRYKVFGIVTNMDWIGDVLIQWLHQRCGKSEEAHAAMKNDFAGGQFPSGDFGENAAWWWIMILAYNLNVLMKRLVLGGSWVNKRMKAIRFGFIHIGGRVIEHSRRLLVRISGNHPSSELLISVRRRIVRLATASS